MLCLGDSITVVLAKSIGFLRVSKVLILLHFVLFMFKALAQVV